MIQDLQRSPKEIERCKRITEISAHILNILAKYKCSITDFKSIVFEVTYKVEESSILREEDYLKKLTDE